MLTLATVLEIRRLLDEGELSQRAIADKLRVSRGVVGSIANGRRALFGRRESGPPRRRPRIGQLPIRCPGCGGMVYQPCILCCAREHRRRLLQLRRLAAALPRRPLRGPRRVA